MNMIDILAAKDTAAFVTPCGDRYREDFVGKLNKDNGVIALVSVGKTDLFEYIQSFKEETDITSLIARAENGDLSAFSSAVFGDFTDMPDTYADALNMVIEAEREFNHLPSEIKNKFNDDFRQYIATAGSPDWLSKFGVTDAVTPGNGDQKEEKKDEVKNDDKKVEVKNDGKKQ